MNKKNATEVLKKMKENSNSNGLVTISMTSISKSLKNKSLGSVHSAIQKLIANGTIEIVSKGNRKAPTTYRVISKNEENSITNLSLSNVKTVLTSLLNEVGRIEEENKQLANNKKDLLDKINKIKEILG